LKKIATRGEAPIPERPKAVEKGGGGGIVTEVVAQLSNQKKTNEEGGGRERGSTTSVLMSDRIEPHWGGARERGEFQNSNG